MPTIIPTIIDLTKPIPELERQLIQAALQMPNKHLWSKNITYIKKGTGAQFKFSHHLIKRKSKSKNDEFRYEIISSNKLGEGSQCSVYGISGTLNFTNNDEVISKFPKSTEKPRAIKIEKSKRFNITKAYGEYFICKDIQHLAVKEPVIVGNISYMVLRRFPGLQLSTIIEYSHIFTVEQRLNLSIALLKALKTQVLDHDIYHRDLYARNILVDMNAVPIKVNIIDYGIAIKHKSHEDLLCISKLIKELWDGASNSKNESALVKRILNKMLSENDISTAVTQAISSLEATPAVVVRQRIASTLSELTTLQQQVNSLKKRGHANVAKKLETFKTKMETKLNGLKNKNDKDLMSSIKQTVGECQKLINNVKPFAEDHRNINYILANIALGIVGLGVFYTGAIVINKLVTGNFLFFSKTESLKATEEVEINVNNISLS